MAAMRWTAFAVALLCIVVIPVYARVFGVLHHHAAYFDAAQKVGAFRCLDDSATIQFSSVNDDICDCADGSDEPGTSACIALRGSTVTLLPPEWKFQCTDDAHISQVFPHNRVNDGICDCCDGSDEAETPVLCANRCAEVAKELMVQRHTEQESNRKSAERKAEMRIAAQRRREEVASDLAALEAQHAKMVSRLAVLEERKIAAEKEENAPLAELPMKANESDVSHVENEFADDATFCIQWRETDDCIPNGSRLSNMDKECFSVIDSGSSGYCECWANFRRDESDEAPKAGLEREAKGDEVEMHMNIITYNFSCGHPTLTCMYVCAHNGEVGVDEGHEKVQHFSTLTVAEEYYIIKDDLDGLETRIKDAKKRLSPPTITTEELLLTLEGMEFNLDNNEHTYKIIMFDRIEQCDLEKVSYSILLGKWNSFAESTYSTWTKDTRDFSRMIYDDGLECWNSGSRRVEVHLVCGPENKLVMVEEPSFCKYSMMFETPAICDD
ncbi:hypothetical protein LPMP_260970 [Leishmania panamensis]|uniref:Glucosidase 2 subunit beta n=1 Tax=Leishmania panamensis TaxID=5679 RepID=A0A088RTJ2_LEIPA|nr:hypothetical protein LPMP_260970 [Leishmania panamensis]AIN99210.1 hypothetical protein LPMP_260970 [Leishmania panamensis]